MAGGYQQNKIFNDDLINELVSYIEAGNYVPTACAAVGIGQSTYYKWLSHGQEVNELVEARPNGDELKARMADGEIVLDFDANQVRSWIVRERILMASARSEAFAVAMVRKHMPDQWTAAMTFLERRFPGRWKRKEQIDIGEATVDSGIDETLLLNDPTAVSLIHDALDRVAKGLPSGESAVIDAEVVED